MAKEPRGARKEKTKWLSEQVYHFECFFLNRLAYENLDDVREPRCRTPLVNLMPNSLEMENTSVETENALGNRFNLFRKRSGSVFP